MKKAIAILFLTLTLSMAAQAQIFIQEDEYNTSRTGTEVNGELGNIIYHGVDADQPNYVPVGEDIFVLAALGIIYLKNKKNK